MTTAQEPAESVITQIERSQIQDRMKRALLLVASGSSIKAAAREAGYSGTTNLRQYCQRFGLTRAAPQTKDLLEKTRRVTGMALDRMELLLEDEESDVKLRDLSVVSGIGLDKIAKKERWGTDLEGSQGALSAMETIAEQLKKQNLRLEVSLRPESVEQAADDGAIVLESEDRMSWKSQGAPTGRFRKNAGRDLR